MGAKVVKLFKCEIVFEARTASHFIVNPKLKIMNNIMRKTCTFMFAALFSVTTVHSQINVDERFELTGIAFRLADDISFRQSEPAQYLSDVDAYFHQYEEHELILFLKKMLSRHAVFDLAMPACLASDIKITKSRIVWNDEWITISENSENEENKTMWSRQEFDEYLKLLNKFYKDTHFHQFYLEHRHFYSKAEEKMSQLVSTIDSNWFTDFFGSPFHMDNIWIAPTNGWNNFSLTKKNKSDKVYYNCVIGCWETDTAGDPIYGTNEFTVLIHEICHNYNDSICKRSEPIFKDICDTLFHYVENELTRAHYGYPAAILYENINRLAEYSYYISHGTLSDSLLDDRLKSQVTIGFIWFEEMLRYMSIFHSNRAEYPTFQDFFPKIKMFLEQVVENMDSYYLPRFNTFRSRVIATIPINNSVVDTSLNQIVIIFSKPMFTDFKWIDYPKEKENIQPFPIVYDEIRWIDEYTYVMPLGTPLHSNTTYGFRVSPYLPDKKYYYGPVPFDLIITTK